MSAKVEADALASMRGVVDWTVGIENNISYQLTSFFANEVAVISSCSRLLLDNTYEALLVAGVSSGSTLFFFYYRDSSDKMLAYNLNWTLLSIALVFPLTMTMQSAFSRREVALVQISTFKANMMSVFLAHLHWDWWVRN